jgi:hypothetical protein
MTTTNTTTANTSSSNLYPFMTKTQVIDRLQKDDAFVMTCFQVLCGRQVEDEKDKGETLYKNRSGLSSSDSVKVTKLATALAAEGETISPQILDWSDITPAAKETVVAFCRQSLCCGKGIGSYNKQLAAHFRNEAMKASPELAKAAGVFFQPQK